MAHISSRQGICSAKTGTKKKRWNLHSHSIKPGENRMPVRSPGSQYMAKARETLIPTCKGHAVYGDPCVDKPADRTWDALIKLLDLAGRAWPIDFDTLPFSILQGGGEGWVPKVFRDSWPGNLSSNQVNFNFGNRVSFLFPCVLRPVSHASEFL